MNSMSKTKSYKIAEMDYTKEDAANLRSSMIDLRDAMLKSGNMEWAVALSHTIAFMAVAMDIMWKD